MPITKSGHRQIGADVADVPITKSGHRQIGESGVIILLGKKLLSQAARRTRRGVGGPPRVNVLLVTARGCCHERMHGHPFSD